MAYLTTSQLSVENPLLLTNVNTIKLILIVAAWIGLLKATVLAVTPGQFELKKKRTDNGFDAVYFSVGSGQLFGRDADGYVNGISLGSGLSLSGTTLSSTFAGTLPWSSITGKPTTVGAAGLTDALNDNDIGVTVQEQSAVLQLLSGTSVTAFGQGLLSTADATALTTTLGLGETDSVTFGSLTATTLSGALATSNLTGNLAIARFNGGTNASSTTYWCGDGTWKTVTAGLTQTEADALYQPLAEPLTTLSSTLISGYGTTLLGLSNAAALRGNLGLATTDTVTFGNVIATGLTGNLAASNISGNLSLARFNSASGASGSTYWRGDGTWSGVGWGHLTGTPTTLAGYGITDALSASTAAATYAAQTSALTSLSTATVAAYGKSLLGAGDAATHRSLTGTLAYSADLAGLAAEMATGGAGTSAWGVAWLAQSSASSARAALNLDTGDSATLGSLTVGALTVSGTVTANIGASSLTGNLAVARFNGGTNASASTYWRGDGTWADPLAAPTALSIAAGNQASATAPFSTSTTWTNSATAYRGWQINITDTASPAYSTTWANNSAALDVRVGGVTNFAVLHKGSEGFPCIRLGSSDSSHALIKHGGNGVVVIRRSDTFDNVAIGYLNDAPGVCVAGGGRIGINATAGQMSGGNSIPTTFFTREADQVVQWGNDLAGPLPYMIKAGDRITSDGVGANLMLAGGRGRGASGGALLLQTAPTAASGTAGALRTVLQINADGSLDSPTMPVEAASGQSSTHTLTIFVNGVRYKILAKQE